MDETTAAAMFSVDVELVDVEAFFCLVASFGVSFLAIKAAMAGGFL